MSVLIAGCGDVGTETGLRLARDGHHVIGWRRSPGKLPDRIEGVAADLAGALPAIPRDVHTVIIAVAADAHNPSAYRSAYVDGLANVLNALERDAVSPRRVLFVSSTAVYGDAGGRTVDESTPEIPGYFTGEILLEAEALLFRRLAGTATSVTSLRLGGIYGPGRTRLIDQVKSGRAVIPDQPRHTNRIHRDDAAAAIVHLTTMAPEPDAVYLGVDKEPAELGEVLRFLANELSLGEPATGHIPLARGGDKRCSSAALQATGFRFTYPSYREGYQAVLAGIGTRHP
ncbi:NAD-dependent epimerase/dehydratase family protein [Arthrobacter sp. I2-34]|uniref:NAD-dependent epimerase/dehydratase family protein n=1 Tax=Arthrobacter hankyongi TaxID=2904801 RepID=A0ABS9LE37_9MICC|nr:NAD-dependent epimerase/dehydratase family protein [Arthrobacter hankyongi]MCG2624898.1 NAD-dependent epimerase/dehydratase family protein [Arthrobacter hankyongi]